MGEDTKVADFSGDGIAGCWHIFELHAPANNCKPEKTDAENIRGILGSAPTRIPASRCDRVSESRTERLPRHGRAPGSCRTHRAPSGSSNRPPLEARHAMRAVL